MTTLYFLFAAIGGLVILRAAFLLVFAELGRKQDLIKHIYKSGTDFQIAVIVPFMDSRKIGPLQELLHALHKQDYPANRVGIHIVSTEDSVFGLPNDEALPENVRIWTYPVKNSTCGNATAWMIERLLAAGGPSKLFVFLNADDIVRPDFLRSVTTKAFDCFAIQGYIALKRPPKGLFAQVVALSTRLVNRIENAGRFHLGLSCKLLESGWVVRQELLEMIPYRQGRDLDNQEYTTLLNLNGYRVNWAPNVVVYKDERVEPSSLLSDIAHSTLNRFRLTFQYGIQLLIQGITRFDLNLFEQAWSLVKPPQYVIGLGAFIGAIFLYVYASSTSAFLAFLFVTAFWGIQLISLAVARCSFRDVLTFVSITPIVYTIGLLLFPFFLITAFVESLFQGKASPQKVRMGRRFDESQPVLTSRQAERTQRGKKKNHRLIPTFRDLDLDDEEESSTITISKTFLSEGKDLADEFSSIYEEQVQRKAAAKTATSYASHPLGLEPPINHPGPYEHTVNLPITNGKNQVLCTLKTHKVTDHEGLEEYYLVFSYKNLSFTTRKYRILDQAYYELLTKLKTKGFTVVSCGSCAYFYRPTVGNPYGVAQDNGYCLFGKMGQDVNVATDAVTVLSEACQEHTNMGYREQVVTEWQESIQQRYTLS